MAIEARFFPEWGLDRTCTADGTVAFYTFVKATYLKFGAPPRVLDFGAGRGAWVELDRSGIRRQMRDLRIGAARVVAADVDPVVAMNPCSHEQVVIRPGDPLPFADGAFEVIVADNVFEHLEDPAAVAAELGRVLVPGGFVCARTPNKWGYVALAARAMPRPLYARALARAQPERKAEDVFPTVYKLNTPAAIRAAFPGYALHYFRKRTNPSYHFGSPAIYAVMTLVEHLMPRPMLNSICAFLQKPR